jgi:hypothetical protein
VVRTHNRAIGFLLSIIVLSTGVVGRSVAEGRCPPGQYPIGGQGAGGCAPTGAGSGGSGDPVPTGRWHKTWGAVAFSKSGDAGAVVGKMSKAEAVAGAVEKCSQWGATDCKEGLTFKNQCAAVIQADKSLGTRLDTGATKEIALERATAACRKSGSHSCTTIYAECSMPYFERF